MQIKIVLVDDDTDDRQLFASAARFASDKLTCITLRDCYALLPTLAEMGHDLPNIIFLDVNMPQMSGWDCLAILKDAEHYRHIPVVMYSTSKHDEEIARAKEAGALCFFTKPDDFTILIDAIADVVNHLQNNTLDTLCEDSKMYF